MSTTMMEEQQPIASTSTLKNVNEERQIAIRLTTKDTAYSIPATKFLVPSNWRRFHLSELINKVLENSEFPLPLLRSSLFRSTQCDPCEKKKKKKVGKR
jgi:ribosome biogenesis protein YTM1